MRDLQKRASEPGFKIRVPVQAGIFRDRLRNGGSQKRRLESKQCGLCVGMYVSVCENSCSIMASYDEETTMP